MLKIRISVTINGRTYEGDLDQGSAIVKDLTNPEWWKPSPPDDPKEIFELLKLWAHKGFNVSSGAGYGGTILG